MPFCKQVQTVEQQETVPRSSQCPADDISAAKGGVLDAIQESGAEEQASFWLSPRHLAGIQSKN